MRLAPLSRFDAETARGWRNTDSVRLGLRTPYMLPEEMQARFYDEVICNSKSPHRYWGIRDDRDVFVGMTGLTDISAENGHGEISMMIQPGLRGKGIGAQAVGLVLVEAFERMRLDTVFAECYMHNPAISFWGRMAKKYSAIVTTLPRRKFWDGVLHDSLFIAFTAEGYQGKRAA